MDNGPLEQKPCVVCVLCTHYASTSVRKGNDNNNSNSNLIYKAP